MDYLSLLLLLSFTLAIFNHIFIFKLLRRSSPSLPPGPRPFPIIGNILDMGENPHQSLTKLSKTFGPLMTLKLGSITAIIISSPEFAKEALQKHDQALSGRVVPDSARPLDHHKYSVAWLPASDLWRSLRKVMATQLFSPRKMEESQNLRQKKVQDLLVFVRESCENRKAIDIGGAAFTTIFNLLSNTFFSIDLANYNSNKSLEFYDAVVGVLEENGLPNMADYFPLLRVFDPQGIYRRSKIYYVRLLEAFEQIIVERLQLKSSSTKDVLDVLLNITQESHSELSLIDMKHLLMVST